MSSNPSRRLIEHNAGKVRSTKARRPYKIILTEKFPDRKTARQREKYYSNVSTQLNGGIDNLPIDEVEGKLTLTASKTITKPVKWLKLK